MCSLQANINLSGYVGPSSEAVGKNPLPSSFRWLARFRSEVHLPLFLVRWRLAISSRVLFSVPVCKHLHLRSSKGKLKFSPFSIGSSLTSPVVFLFDHITATPARENSVFKGSDDTIGPIKISQDNFPILTSVALNDIRKTPLCHVPQAVHRF